MAACITCGASFNGTERDLAKLFLKQYKELGIERYVYRLSEKDGFKFVKKAYFSIIFESQIQPNLINGADYFHIKEFQ